MDFGPQYAPRHPCIRSGIKGAMLLQQAIRTQELCGSRGGRPGLPSLINLRFLWTQSTTSTTSDRQELFPLRRGGDSYSADARTYAFTHNPFPPPPHRPPPPTHTHTQKHPALTMHYSLYELHPPCDGMPQRNIVPCVLSWAPWLLFCRRLKQE